MSKSISRKEAQEIVDFIKAEYSRSRDGEVVTAIATDVHFEHEAIIKWTKTFKSHITGAPIRLSHPAVVEHLQDGDKPRGVGRPRKFDEIEIVGVGDYASWIEDCGRGFKFVDAFGKEMFIRTRVEFKTRYIPAAISHRLFGRAVGQARCGSIVISGIER